MTNSFKDFCIFSYIWINFFEFFYLIDFLFLLRSQNINYTECIEYKLFSEFNEDIDFIFAAIKWYRGD